ncbi:MAG: DUF4136 domain-containing protein [Microscillaceae bacterium]|nr:DUF4136 domain-containing protein [Microscillaceae bacterium]
MQKNLLLLGFLGLCAACVGARDYVIDYDYSYQGNFRKYKSFQFMEHTSADTLTRLNANIIEDEIGFRMKLLDYEPVTEKPDLLIIYKIFPDDFQMRGYQQPEMKQWIIKEDSTRKDYKPQQYALNNGTLLIHLVERKTRSTVWMGYASGLRSRTLLVNPRILKNSIISIFDRFEVSTAALRRPKEEIEE